MLFLKDLNVFHIDGKEIPCITALGAPDDRYPGVPGVLCMDSTTGHLYLCTDADILQQMYSWRIVGDVDPAAVQQAVADYMATHPVAGGGFSSSAAALLIDILESAVYSTNVTSKITRLKEALASGGGSGGGVETPDIPDTPDEPDEPVITDDITVTDGVMTIVSVGSAVTVSDGVMMIA